MVHLPERLTAAPGAQQLAPSVPWQHAILLGLPRSLPLVIIRLNIIELILHVRPLNFRYIYKNRVMYSIRYVNKSNVQLS
ncbi:hypothetical protein J2Z28_004500 [Paenibacillus xylanexedens]|uniref:Uncharacterized protein n=1 Tax=Paenibacillus xylanexedens TaxID=528191 RepID=A0ABS4RY63_PAEXY|nr:hypothetical protein [Paenibacillus xylanexedens]